MEIRPALALSPAQLLSLPSPNPLTLFPVAIEGREHCVMALDLLNPKTALDLGNIRYTLIRLEDTIIFNLIERAQFPLNRSIYVPGAVPLPNFKGSFLDWLLAEVEQTHGTLRRSLALTLCVSNMFQLKSVAINPRTNTLSRPTFPIPSSLLFNTRLCYIRNKS